MRLQPNRLCWTMRQPFLDSTIGSDPEVRNLPPDGEDRHVCGDTEAKLPSAAWSQAEPHSCDHTDGPLAIPGSSLEGVGGDMTGQSENALQESHIWAWRIRNVAMPCCNAAQRKTPATRRTLGAGERSWLCHKSGNSLMHEQSPSWPWPCRVSQNYSYMAIVGSRCGFGLTRPLIS